MSHELYFVDIITILARRKIETTDLLITHNVVSCWPMLQVRHFKDRLPGVDSDVKHLLVLASEPLLPRYPKAQKAPKKRQQKKGSGDSNYMRHQRQGRKASLSSTRDGRGKRRSSSPNRRPVMFPQPSVHGLVCCSMGEDGTLDSSDSLQGIGTEKEGRSPEEEDAGMSVEEVVTALFDWKLRVGPGAEVVVMTGGEGVGSQTWIQDLQGPPGGANTITQLCIGSLGGRSLEWGWEQVMMGLGPR